ncbi:MAG: histidine triad nucleotide-binding protein [Betaproteobacteria bacterium]|nr:histidine triad nucleotide-binding protein [Betaproteobacteria bacterium]
MSEDCIFCKIVRGEIPARKVFENDEMLAFHDIHPLRPVHLLLIPKKHIASLAGVGPEDAPLLGNMMAAANRLAVEAGSPEGFRLIVNVGSIGGQEVPHLHFHIVGGPEMVGPMLRRAENS